VFRKTFKSLAKCPVTILNPAVDFSKLHGVHVAEEKLPEMISQWQNFSGDFVLVLSINRFERKKNIQLAVYAFAYLKQKKGLDLSNVKLILSGGYDIRESENVEYDLELREICKLSNLSVSDFPDFQGEVVFFHSLTDDQKSYLLSKCRCVVYTPSNEHFGIVPLEAMFSRKPVVAIANGGPLETIVHKETGYLCEDDSQLVESFAESIQQLLQNPSLAERMGKSGRDRAQTKFSLDHFSRSLDSALNSLIN
jgi:alpha-1,3/alpha-1,6-mannosyltransferase